jgi:flagellar basal-body rod modification protein FlgD
MSVNSVGNAYNTPPANSTQAGVNSGATLDKNGFLKMLTEQIKNQDPSSTQDPNQYFQTISQMTQVEQMTNLAQQSMTQLTQEKASDAMGMIGKTALYIGADGTAATGVVNGVDLSSPEEGPLLAIGGVTGIDMGSLLAVKQT